MPETTRRAYSADRQSPTGNQAKQRIIHAKKQRIKTNEEIGSYAVSLKKDALKMLSFGRPKIEIIDKEKGAKASAADPRGRAQKPELAAKSKSPSRLRRWSGFAAIRLF